MPAMRASLYTVRATLGTIPQAGIVPISERYDIAGPMGKSVIDVADLLTILVDKEKTSVPEGGYRTAMTTQWDDIKVGTLDVGVWLRKGKRDDKFMKFVPEAIKQMKEETLDAYARIKTLAKEYHENVSLRLPTDFEIDGTNAILTMLTAEFKPALDAYLKCLKRTKVRSLQSLVEWNKAHQKEALTDEYPDQARLEASLNYENTDNKTDKALAHIASVAKSIDATFAKYDIDVIIGPGDCDLSSYSAAAGKSSPETALASTNALLLTSDTGVPIATLPMSTLRYNGRPIGLMLLAPAHKEATLIKVMSAWEATFSGRRNPEEFLKHAHV